MVAAFQGDETALRLPALGLEVTQPHLCCTLTAKASPRAKGGRGWEIDSPVLCEEWQSHIANGHVGRKVVVDIGGDDLP